LSVSDGKRMRDENGGNTVLYATIYDFYDKEYLLFWHRNLRCGEVGENK